jgi:menaquinone-dependent protoporphyrinogen oxidase
MDEHQKLSRRKFLYNTTKISAGIGLTTSGLFSIANADTSDKDKLEIPDDIKYIESECGSGSEKNILVIYASMYGSTGGIANAIGHELCSKDTKVDIRLIKNIDDISNYDAVVVGSAIRSSEWLHEAVDFVEKHKEKLSQIPVAYFLSCMSLARTKNPQHHAEMRQRAASWLVPVYEEIPQVKPLSTGLFAGAIHFDKLPAMQRLMYPIISGNDIEGDFRNWKKIKTWARKIKPQLLQNDSKPIQT